MLCSAPRHPVEFMVSYHSVSGRHVCLPEAVLLSRVQTSQSVPSLPRAADGRVS